MMPQQTYVSVCAAVLLLAGSATLTSAYGHSNDNACFDTTRAMKQACHADIADDFHEGNAKCLNSDDPRGCKGGVRDAYRTARGECREQADGRNSLCERLPDPGPYIVELDPADFTGQCGAGNPYFPLIPGTVTTFVNATDGEEETVVVTVTDETREIEGIAAIVVNDEVFEGLPDASGDPTGDPIEKTDDYYAIDNGCHVWYLGEIAQNFEDGYLTNLDGSFIAGENGAQAGIVMLANPQVGDVYRQEFALGDAEDAAEVLSTTADSPVSSAVFDCSGACIKSEDFIGPDADAVELKYYAAGVGFVVEQLPDGAVVLELVKVESP